MRYVQPPLSTLDDHEASLAASAEDDSTDYGAVFTKRWVVEMILDLAGYSTDQDLVERRALEPSCGQGAFLVPMVERLLASAQEHGRDVAEAVDALVAVDLRAENVEECRKAVAQKLSEGGCEPHVALHLAEVWVQHGDFLLRPIVEDVDFVVGNPPYVRLEAVPAPRSAAYRRACPAMTGRADIYVGFYERGLLALNRTGVLAFICADRWMRNSYGSRLRALVSDAWSVEAIVSLTGVDAFEEEVDAYPAVTVIRRATQDRGPLIVEGAEGFGPAEASSVSRLASAPQVPHAKGEHYRATRLASWFRGSAGWPHGSPDRLALVADLEDRFPPLEDVGTGTKVGIGIATGNDGIFIVRDSSSIEADRLLPLAMPRDLANGVVEWSGNYLINPWDEHGLVDLSEWPRLAEYLEPHHNVLSQRHTAEKTGRWYRTIDRVIEGLTERPKLYIPDLKEVIFPVLDHGTTYPHHNLYWVRSDGWDPRVLGGLLLSDIANMFIEAYSVRMRGGFLRFQAQYLRRIRLPRLADIDTDAEAALMQAFDARDREAATAVALSLYGLRTLPD